VAIAALSAAAALALTGCSSSGGGGNGGGGGGGNAGGGGLGGGNSPTNAGGSSQTYKIGFEGPLSGPNAQLGINEVYGVEIAVQQANANKNLGFKVQLVKSDDEGDPAKSPAAADQLIQDPTILGVIGPSFSGSTLAVGKKYSAAGMPFITPSATNATLQQQGFTTFHRIVPNDNVEGSQAADWLARRHVKKLFVLQDLSTYGKGVGDTVAKQARKDHINVIEQGLDGTTTKNYNPIAQTIKASGADALFYGGYDAQAALLAKALKAVGYTGITVGGNGIKSSVFTQSSGAAGNGWYMTCGCQDATVAPQSKAFASAYQGKFHTPASTYSPEAYDATNALIQAIKDAASNGTPTRASVEAAVNHITYHGITTTVKFQPNGDLLSSVQTVNLYRQLHGKIIELGNIKQQH
jgi:branched-chain amino acid transport system substrate-binding protein